MSAPPKTPTALQDAGRILQSAVDLDRRGFPEAALREYKACYLSSVTQKSADTGAALQAGLDRMMVALRDPALDAQARAHVASKTTEYMTRAEQLQAHIDAQQARPQPPEPQSPAQRYRAEQQAGGAEATWAQQTAATTGQHAAATAAWLGQQWEEHDGTGKVDAASCAMPFALCCALPHAMLRRLHHCPRCAAQGQPLHRPTSSKQVAMPALMPLPPNILESVSGPLQP